MHPSSQLWQGCVSSSSLHRTFPSRVLLSRLLSASVASQGTLRPRSQAARYRIPPPPPSSVPVTLQLALRCYPYVVGFGFIFLLPPVMVTLTKRRVYVILFFARPLGVFFFSCGSTCALPHQSLVHIAYAGLGVSTFGVCDLTLPARASEPWTLPMIAVCGVQVGLMFACEESAVAVGVS